MKNIIKISKFNTVEDSFIFSHYEEFIITYLVSRKIHFIRVVVNGRLTNQKINILDWKKNKHILLSAISDFKNDRIRDKSTIKKL